MDTDKSSPYIIRKTLVHQHQVWLLCLFIFIGITVGQERHNIVVFGTTGAYLIVIEDEGNKIYLWRDKDVAKILCKLVHLTNSMINIYQFKLALSFKQTRHYMDKCKQLLAVVL